LLEKSIDALAVKKSTLESTFLFIFIYPEESVHGTLLPWLRTLHVDHRYAAGILYCYFQFISILYCLLSVAQVTLT